MKNKIKTLIDLWMSNTLDPDDFYVIRLDSMDIVLQGHKSTLDKYQHLGEVVDAYGGHDFKELKLKNTPDQTVIKLVFT